MSEADGEAIERLRALMAAFGEGLVAWAERMRPAFEQLAAAVAATDPQLLAREDWRPCYCLCVRAHPGDRGICETMSAVTTRRFTTELTGPVDVPLCAPCAVAQGLAELAGGS